MTDLTKALAAARASNARYQENATNENARVAADDAHDLLAALDAQEPVLYVVADQLDDPNMIGIGAVRPEHQDRERHYTTPLYLAPQAPPAAPALDAIRGAVARGWCSAENSHKIVDVTLGLAIADEVAKLLQAPPAAVAVLDGATLHRAFRDNFRLVENGTTSEQWWDRLAAAMNAPQAPPAARSSTVAAPMTMEQAYTQGFSLEKMRGWNACLAALAERKGGE